jgi:hypothetical protein
MNFLPGYFNYACASLGHQRLKITQLAVQSDPKPGQSKDITRPAIASKMALAQ